MSKTKDLLLARQKEVATEIAPLKAELKEIDAALAAIGGHPVVAGKIGTREGTIPQQALEILHDHPNGLPTRTMAREMRHRFGREITKRNMSWHLSHLKRDGELVLDGENWNIPTDQNETPGSTEPSAPSQPDDGDGTPSSNESKDDVADFLAELPGANPAQPGE